jgi:hypothetical protein
MSAAVLVVGLLLSVRALLPVTLGEQVRRSLLAALRSHYPGLEIQIDSGHYEPGRGIRLSGVQVRARHQPDGALPLLTIDQIYVDAEVDLAALRAGRAPLTAERVRLVGVTANAWSDATGQWPLAQLWPPPRLGPGCPLIEIAQARLRLCRSADPLAPALELSQLQARLEQPRGSANKRFRLRGSGGVAESLRVHGELNGDQRLTILGVVQSLSLDARFHQRWPPALAHFASALRDVEARGDIQFRLDGPPDRWRDHWAARIDIERARCSDARLPAPLEAIRGQLVATPAGLRIESADFLLAGAACTARGALEGLRWPAPLQLEVTAEQLELNADLLRGLPGRAGELDAKIRPRGKIDLAGTIAYDGRRWRLESDIDCHDVSVTVDKFPYPVERLRGRIQISDRIARARDLRCRAGGAQLVCSFQLAPPESSTPHWIELRGETGAVRIDQTLLAALTPRGEAPGKLENFARSLAPGGGVRLIEARFVRDPSGAKRKRIDLEVVDGRLRYEKFPYPLYEVRGRMLVEDDRVELVQFQAQNNGGAQIQCEGSWRAQPDGPGGQLDLQFTGYAIPLDDGLRTALNPGARQTWDALQPGGVLEQLKVRVEHGPQPGPPHLTITAHQWDAGKGPRREVSMAPQALPYRLGITRGTVRMRGDEVTISDIDGYHGASRVSAEGTCKRRADGRWQLDIELLTGSRLRPDHELIAALPDEIRGGFSKLQLREPVSLRGTTQLILPDAAHPRATFSWDVRMQLEGNRIGDAGTVGNIRGEVDVRGSSGESGTAAEGTVRIDSMHVRDLQITGIEGPFAIQGPRLSLGKELLLPSADAASQRDRDAAVTPIRGRIFGGQLGLTGDVALDTGQFAVNLKLSEAEVRVLLNELGQTPGSGLAGPQTPGGLGEQMGGKFGGTVALEGTLGAADLLRGTGSASLSQAKLYQLPLIVQLLNQLSLTPTEDVAFTDGTTEFALDGDLLTLRDLKLWGDLVALHGSGTVNSRRELDLAFNTRVSPQSIWSKMVLPLRSQRYTLWTIYVRGPLAMPEIERRALDAVGETLERLLPGMEQGGVLGPPGIGMPWGGPLGTRAKFRQPSRRR